MAIVVLEAGTTVTVKGGCSELTLSSATVVLEVGAMVARLVIVKTATSVVDMEVIAMVFLLVTTGIVVALLSRCCPGCCWSCCQSCLSRPMSWLVSFSLWRNSFS